MPASSRLLSLVTRPLTALLLAVATLVAAAAPPSPAAADSRRASTVKVTVGADEVAAGEAVDVAVQVRGRDARERLLVYVAAGNRCAKRPADALRAPTVLADKPVARLMGRDLVGTWTASVTLGEAAAAEDAEVLVCAMLHRPRARAASRQDFASVTALAPQDGEAWEEDDGEWTEEDGPAGEDDAIDGPAPDGGVPGDDAPDDDAPGE